MRYIDIDEVELELPDDWGDKVASAWTYVNRKVAEAEVATRAKGVQDGWDAQRLDTELLNATSTARKTAIASKNDVWGSLSEVLAKQSNGKCWYCETNELRSDNPIDHFRPKGRVAECSDHPGYWWLAFDWRNFRFACTYCNSRRVEVDTAGGKQDHFPVFTPPDWNKTPQDNNQERPKLLDPTDPDDCELLAFNINGLATPNCSDQTSDNYKKAIESIEKFHLNHGPTKKARMAIRQKINQLVANTNDLLQQGVAAHSQQIKSNKKELMKLIRPSCTQTKFNTAARLYLNEFAALPWVKSMLDREPQ